jgi:nitrogenase molybdenum-iron protein alpha chain
LRRKLKGLKGYVAMGAAYAHGEIGVLRELDVDVGGSLVFHHDPVYDSREPRQDALGHLIDTHGEENLAVMAQKKFHRTIAAHATAPYKPWWLDQPDPFELARQAAE